MEVKIVISSVNYMGMNICESMCSGSVLYMTALQTLL